jgi:hypothetical protein
MVEEFTRTLDYVQPNLGVLARTNSIRCLLATLAPSQMEKKWDDRLEGQLSILNYSGEGNLTHLWTGADVR